jgi:hypothetical protein
MNEQTTKPTKTTKSGSETRRRQGEVKMRVDEAEKADVKSRAEVAGLSESGFLRALVFGKDTPQPRAARRLPVGAEELGALRYELRKIGGNLNQIAHHQNQGKAVDDRALTALYAEHSAALKAIREAMGKEAPEPPAPKIGLVDKLFGRDRSP